MKEVLKKFSLSEYKHRLIRGLFKDEINSINKQIDDILLKYRDKVYKEDIEPKLEMINVIRSKLSEEELQVLGLGTCYSIGDFGTFIHFSFKQAGLMRTFKTKFPCDVVIPFIPESFFMNYPSESGFCNINKSDSEITTVDYFKKNIVIEPCDLEKFKEQNEIWKAKFIPSNIKTIHDFVEFFPNLREQVIEILSDVIQPEIENQNKIDNYNKSMQDKLKKM